MRRVAGVLRALFAAVVLAGLVVGVPVLLVWLVGQPLPTSLPSSWAAVSDAVAGRYGYDWTWLVKSLAVVTWLGWAQFVWAVSVEFAAAVKGRKVRVHRGFGLSHSLASTLVSAILTLGPTGMVLASSSTGAVAPAVSTVPLRQDAVVVQVDEVRPEQGPLRVELVAAVADLGAAGPESQAAGSGVATVEHEVAKGDTLWGLAERYYSDGTQCVRIFEANRGVPQPGGRALRDIDLIVVGWTLTIPDVPVTAGDASPAFSASAPVGSAVGSADGASAVVDAAAEAPPASAVIPDAAVSPAPAPSSSSGIGGGQAGPEVPPTTVTTAVSTSTGAAQSGDGEQVGSPAVSEAAGDDGTTEDVPEVAGWLPALAPVVAGIASATVLAGGLLTVLRAVRRRRTTASALLPRPSQAGPLEKAIIAAADVPLVRWAGQELADLMRRLDGRRVAGVPVAMELSEEAGIELLWDAPNPVAPAPWEATDGGIAWRLLYDPDQPVPAPESPSGLPGLVTIGHRDGRQLLVDVEAYGSVAVTGDPAAVEAFVRSVVLELGASDEIADAFVLLSGLDVDGVEQFARVASAESLEAVDRLQATADAVGVAMEKSGVATTFAYRLGSRTALEVVVAVARDDQDETLAALATAARPRRGVAAIVVGDVASAGARVEVRADGTARLEPLGVEFQAAGVSRELAAEIAVLLDEAAQEEIGQGPSFEEHVAALGSAVVFDERRDRDWGRSADDADSPTDDAVAPAEPTDSPDGLDELEQPSEAGPDADDEQEEGEDGWELPRPEVLVRVLGAPTVVDRPGLGRRETVLAVFLACAARPVGTDAIQDAVWGGAAVTVKTIWNLLSKTRGSLGKLADGRFVFPPAQKPENLMALDGDVWTDYALFRLAYDRAAQEPASAAMPLLREALAMIVGPPFGADGYDWAHVGQFVSDAEGLVERATEHLVELALGAGDIDLARFAVLQGLRALPGNEVLYRSRMRIEDQAGNQAALRSAYNELQVVLGDLDVEPSDLTVSLYRQLARTRR
jgi:phage tail protein X/DNA-binding SARP family transcriptional activator